MINIKHLLRVAVAWISIVYVICFTGVALFPEIRSVFMTYGLHTDINVGQNVITFGTFISGLVIWNVIGLLAALLFAALSNNIKSNGAE